VHLTRNEEFFLVRIIYLFFC